MTTGFLTSIVAQKRAEVAALKAAPPMMTVDRLPRDFAAALRRPGLSVIAEIKRASPSKGILCADLNPAALAQLYEQAGAAAVSCLTDRQFFGAHADDLARVASAVSLPVLCKDFVIDECQIHDARNMGADAILLIVRILSQSQLAEYVGLCRELRLGALVEVHSETELELALACGADVIGINNRDLDTFEVSLATSLRLRPLIPPGRIAVAESGIGSRADVVALDSAGFHAILIGETLVTAADPAARLAELLGQSETHHHR